MSSTFVQTNSQSSLEKLPPRSLVFIDSGVEDYESLAAGVLPGQQVVILDRTKNGIEQITSEIEKYASTYGAIDSVHIISHGSSGSIQLGNTALNSDNIEQYKGQLEKWQTSLAPQADIMLYGCDVAAGTGANFVDKLSQLTGADVAASTNITTESDLLTTTLAAFASGVGEPTLVTTISCPAVAKSLPGFSCCNSFGLAWNFSPSASSGDS